MLSTQGHTCPSYIQEVAALRAPRTVHGEIRRDLTVKIPLLRVHAGGPRFCRLLGKWIDAGKYLRRSAAAAPITEAVTQLAALTPRSVLAEWAEHPDKCRQQKYSDSEKDTPRRMIGASRLRFNDCVYRLRLRNRAAGSTRLPLTRGRGLSETNRNL